MYQDFSITAISTDLKTKSIIIGATFDIDPTTVNDANIQLVDIVNKNSADISFEIVPKGLVISLKDWPIPNKNYALKVQNLTSVIGEKLVSGISRKVIFDSTICSTIEITYPAFDEEISDLKVSWKEIPKSDTSVPIGSYYIEISTDNAFINIVRGLEIVDRTEIDLLDLKAGQYYLRGRVQKDNEYGLWCETITFIVKEDSTSIPDSGQNNTDPEEDEEIYTPPIEVVSTPEQGETPSSIIIEFDCSIDPDSVGDILIMRRSI
jgi:hypothetical protein